MGPVRFVRYRLARRRVEQYRPTFEANPGDPAIREKFVGLIVDEGRIRYAKVLKHLARRGD